MNRNKFKGLGIALVTPFTKEGKVDFTALRRLLDYPSCRNTRRCSIFHNSQRWKTIQNY